MLYYLRFLDPYSVCSSEGNDLAKCTARDWNIIALHHSCAACPALLWLISVHLALWRIGRAGRISPLDTTVYPFLSRVGTLRARFTYASNPSPIADHTNFDVRTPPAIAHTTYRLPHAATSHLIAFTHPLSLFVTMTNGSIQCTLFTPLPHSFPSSPPNHENCTRLDEIGRD